MAKRHFQLLFVLAIVLQCFVSGLPIALAQNIERCEESAASCPVTLNNETLFYVGKNDQPTAGERAELINYRLTELARKQPVQPDQIQVEHRDTNSIIFYPENNSRKLLLTVTDADANAIPVDRRALAGTYAQKMRSAVQQLSASRSVSISPLPTVPNPSLANPSANLLAPANRSSPLAAVNPFFERVFWIILLLILGLLAIFSKPKNNIFLQLLRLLSTIIAIALLLTFLAELGISLLTKLVFLLGLLFALGMAPILTNAIAGILLYFSPNLNVGDQIRVRDRAGELSGEVEKVSLFSTKVVDQTNHTVSRVPNSTIFNHVIQTAASQAATQFKKVEKEKKFETLRFKIGVTDPGLDLRTLEAALQEAVLAYEERFEQGLFSESLKPWKDNNQETANTYDFTVKKPQRWFGKSRTKICADLRDWMRRSCEDGNIQAFIESIPGRSRG